MGKCVNHVVHDEHSLFEVTRRPGPDLVRCDGQPDCTLQTCREALPTARSTRNLRAEQFVQFGIRSMGLRQALDKSANQFFERSACMPDQRAFNQTVHFLNVPLMQSGKDRMFIGKVLIYGADAHPCDLGNAVGRDRLQPFSF